MSVRTVTSLLHRFDERRVLAATDPERMRPVFQPRGRALLAIDGLQPDVGHEVLWVIRDVLSGRVVLAKAPRSACQADLAALRTRAAEAVGVPVAGVVSDGQHSIRNAVARALPGVPHPLCQFHYRRDAAGPVYEADRHAEKELKKHVRGVREIEPRVEARCDPGAEVVRGSVRLVAGLMTRLGEATAEELAPATVFAWRELREELGYREAARAQQRRFRRDPTNYLKNLEALARQSGLPA